MRPATVRHRRYQSGTERVFWLAVYYIMFQVLFMLSIRIIFGMINAMDHLAFLSPLDWYLIPILLATVLLVVAYLIKRVLDPWVNEPS